MKRLLYALLAAGFLLASCGFVVAEKPVEAVKAQYPAKIELGDSQGTIHKVAPTTSKAVLAAEIVEAQPVSMTADSLK